MSNSELKFSHHLVLIIIAGVLSFTGAATGTILTAHYQKTNWEREINYEQQRLLLDKRMELIERTVKIINKSSAAVLLHAKLKNICILNRSSKTDIDSLSKSIDQILQKSIPTMTNLTELQAEFMAVVSLDALFFGPQTRKVAERIKNTDSWWKTESRLRDELLEAIQKDLYDEYSNRGLIIEDQD